MSRSKGKSKSKSDRVRLLKLACLADPLTPLRSLKMIGVIAMRLTSGRCRVFELFKTPWEFHRPGAHYDILICSNSMVPKNNARLLFLYGAQRQAFEECRGIRANSASRHDFLSFRGERMPIYGSCLLFNSPGNEVVIHERTKSAAAVSVASDDQMVVRLGFDLFPGSPIPLDAGTTGRICEHTHAGPAHFVAP